MTDDILLTILSLLILAATLFGIGVGYFYSLPFVIRRLRIYRSDRSDPRYVFVKYQLTYKLIIMFALHAFLAVALLVLLLDPDSYARLLGARLGLVAGILAVSSLLVVMRRGHIMVDQAAEDSSRGARGETLDRHTIDSDIWREK